MIEKLQEAFKDIKYLDSKHQYFTSSGKELTSVTKFLSSLKPKFQSEFWSVFKAYQFSGYEVKSEWNNFKTFKVYEPDLPFDAEFRIVSIYDDHSHLEVTPEDVLAQWSLDGLVGTTRGTYIHNYLEDLESRLLDEPKIEIPSELDTPQAINYFNSLRIAKELAKQYKAFADENLILVAAEFIVGDPTIGLAGRFDRLYFNKQSNKYEIWDFKTDKQIRYKSSFGKLKMFEVPDCEYEKYSLQTSLYKKLIEDAIPDVKLGTSHVVWFNLKDNRYEIIPCKDYTQLITDTLNENNRSTSLEY